MQKWKQGNIETLQHRNMDMETWKHGNMETQKHRKMETFKMFIQTFQMFV